MKKVILFGELLMRLAQKGFGRFVQADEFDVRFTGAEANAGAFLVAGEASGWSSAEVRRAGRRARMRCMDGMRVLVTGSGTGIGKGIALEFAREGAVVALHYSHSAQVADAAVREIRDPNANRLKWVHSQ